MTHYDFDLCENERCSKKQECDRYRILKINTEI